MNRNWIVVVTLAAALLIPISVRAHDGHAHTVMGTVSSIDGQNLMVKSADGKTVMVMMDAKTKVTQGKAKLELSAIKIGDRVVAAGTEDKAMIMAVTIKVGAAPVAAKPVAKK